MTLEIIPAIDLLGGRCVRLAQGDYDRVSVYGDDPAAVAASFVAAGAPRVHCVDLDGARAGRPHNRDAVRAIVAAAKDAPVQLGGGMRSLEAVDEALALGVERAILGTAALRDPELVRRAARRHPGRVAVGIDARGGRVAVEGWLETSDALAIDVARCFEDAGVAAIVYTEIARDGMGSGPDLDATAALAAAISIPVIASGGVGSEEHVRRAAATPGLAGLVIGKALYEGGVALGRALEIARGA
ncbi:MAG: 1-(5-phosphoribosyl)-5-[(5-phosphoribosylamino)methylideneamino]imidazole-4-carboxamide isomerase [Proteobacteria bacterium]|nr:MAG: 1-(5-phosphoribosyl)-5-[(5-phosphoribosylamino)methylideneamino]imidazole-4-carboxamide isomerase [Pseudomonadota bacterium]